MRWDDTDVDTVERGGDVSDGDCVKDSDELADVHGDETNSDFRKAVLKIVSPREGIVTEKVIVIAEFVVVVEVVVVA